MSDKPSRPSRTTEQFLLAAKRAEIRALQTLAATCQVVSGVSGLIHQIQRERGISNVYLASRGERFHDQRLAQAATALQAEQELRALLQQHYLKDRPTEASPRVLSSVAFVLQGLDELALLRERVERLGIEPVKMTRAFSRLISGLLSVIFEAADSAGEPAVSRALVALLNFMQGKEYAGQERAWAAIGFAGGGFDDALKEHLESLKAAQDRSFEIFTRFAEDAQKECWSKIAGSENTREVERLRTVIGRIRRPDQISSQLSEIWYELATRRIDAMHALETQLTESLLHLSGDCIEQARRKLREHQGSLATLSLVSANEAPLSMLLDFDTPITPWLSAASTESAAYDARNEAPAARSVYDLLREQAEHLKRIGEDLNEARRTLAERRLVEQAKGLLMKNLGLSEEMAYRRIQQQAMNSNRSLSKVSEMLIQAAQRAGGADPEA
ncbi:MAG: nitrate- and nitrite sensing domain-containing protein [Gammaproteobacteria bacterium]|nr:nitrate- and nitrite sensing domain-containing protein [Gammaproteobacteria bacterium]